MIPLGYAWAYIRTVFHILGLHFSPIGNPEHWKNWYSSYNFGKWYPHPPIIFLHVPDENKKKNPGPQLLGLGLDYVNFSYQFLFTKFSGLSLHIY